MRICDQLKELAELYEQINIMKRHVIGAITHSGVPDEKLTEQDYFAFLASLKDLNTKVKLLNIKISAGDDG